MHCGEGEKLSRARPGGEVGKLAGYWGASHDGGEMLEPQKGTEERRRTNTILSLRSLCLSGDLLLRK